MYEDRCHYVYAKSDDLALETAAGGAVRRAFGQDTFDIAIKTHLTLQ